MIAGLSGNPEDTMRNIERTVESVRSVEPGIPPMVHTEALTGVSGAGATVFPSAIGLGATFDPELAEEIGEVIHDQAKASVIGAIIGAIPGAGSAIAAYLSYKAKR